MGQRSSSYDNSKKERINRVPNIFQNGFSWFWRKFHYEVSANNKFKRDVEYDECNNFNNNNFNVDFNSQMATASRWFNEPIELYSLNVGGQGNLQPAGSAVSTRRMQSRSGIASSHAVREKSVSQSSAMSKMSIGSFKIRKAANQDVENKFPDEIFVSHMTEVFYYPFLVFWQLMISLTIVMTAELIVYNYIYSSETSIVKSISESKEMYIFIFGFNIIYLLDVVLSLIHRLWPEFELKMHFKVRTANWMIFDVLILLPLLLDSYLFKNYQYVLHIIQLLALYRIYFYFGHLRKIMAYSAQIVVLKMFIGILITTLISSSVLYLYSCLPRRDEPHHLCGKGRYKDLIDNFNQEHQKPNNELYLFLYSQYFAFFLLPPQREGVLFENYYFPRIFYLIVLLSLEFYMYLIILPDLCIQHFLANQKFNEYCLRRFVIIQKLTALKYNEIVVHRIAWFYVYAWKKRMNLEYHIETDDIPPQLMRNISFDIFYEALSHSDLFRNQDHEFLRIVANQMSSELHMEGDIIYGKNLFKTAMIYVVQGSVEVLSSEDDTTPLIVFGNGTLLGESCLHISYFSNFILRCHSPTCELHVLHKKDFLLLSIKHKKYCKDIMSSIEDRYNVGRLLKGFSELINEKLRKSISSREQIVEPTSWLKTTANRLLDLHFNTGERMSEWMRNLLQLDWWYKLAYHTTDHLLMLGFPQSGLTTSGDPMLLKISFPLVFRPHSKLHDHWDRIVFMLVIILAIILPYSYSFSCSGTGVMAYLPLFYQCIFVTDIGLQISTGIQTHDGYITDIHRILQHRIQELGFIIDLITVVPIYMFEYLIPEDKANLRSSFQINQLLKLWKIGAFLENKWSARSETHLYVLRFSKFMIYYTFLMYFTCSLFYSFSCFNKCGCLRKMITSQKGVGIINATKLELFICGMYRITDMYLGDPNSKIIISTSLEFYFVIFIRISACFMQVYILSTLIQLCVISHESRSVRRNVKKSLKRIMKNAGVKQVVMERAMRFCRKIEMFEEDARDFTKDLPPSFRVETKLTEYAENLIGHPLFVEAIRDFITSTARMCTTVMIPEKELVINLHHQPEEMFFVKRGFLMVCEGDGVGKVIKPGKGIGVIEVCLEIPYKRTVISITDCELIKLTRSNFSNARNRITGARLAFANTVQTFKELYPRQRTSVLEPDIRIRNELNHNITKLATPAFRKETAMESLFEVIKFGSGARRIKYLWKLISLFQIRNTFHPESGFLWYWEISRWVIAVITAIYFPLNYILHNCWYDTGMITFVLYFAAAVDIYIRLHIAYYDPKTNILITNRMKTASHYYTHGFIMDLICILPFEIIPENKRVIKLLMRYNKVFTTYRFNLGMNLLAERYHNHRQLLYFFQYLITLLVIANALACGLVVTACDIGIDINTEDVYWSRCVVCEKEGWPQIGREIGIEQNYMSVLKIYLLSMYWAASMLTSNSLPYIYARTISERTIALFTVLLGGFLSFHYITMIIAHGVDGNISLRKYQTNTLNLISYLKKKKIPKYILRLVKQHLTVKWNVTRNTSIENIVREFPRPLQNDIMLHIYFNALSLNVILSYANYSFFEKLFDNVSTEIYVKDCNIILSGDVISKVYFLVEGTVDMYDQDDRLTKQVGPGSIFGVTGKLKNELATYSVLAQSTVQVLTIKALDLHNNVLPVEPYLNKAFTGGKAEKLLIPVDKRVSVINLDHVFGTFAYEKDIRPSRKWANSISNKLTNVSKMKTLAFLKRFASYIYWLIVNHWSEEMVFFSWSSSVLFLYTATTCDKSYTLFVIFYMLDIIKSFNIIALLLKMKQKQMYSSLSGIITGVGGILFNVLMVLPYELLFFLIFGVNHVTFLLRVNRLIGLQYLWKYWKFTCRRALNYPLPSKVSIKCAYCLLLFISLLTVATTSLIYFLHNWERNYSYSYLDDKAKGTEFLGTVALLVGLRYQKDHHKTTHYPVSVITFCVVILFVLMRALFITIFFTFFYVCVFDKRFVFPDFWHRYNKLMAFLKDANTTTSLFMAAKRHMELFWQQNEGFYQPQLFDSLPYHLRAAINNYAYGKYVYFSDLFSGCSLNFLRQVAACLRPMTLYSGDMIVSLGTRDGCMYFITSGVVLVNDVQADTTVDVLYKWDSFGLRQGLSTERYEFDYVAYSQVQILRLIFADWEHLIPYYKEDYHRIKKNLNHIASENIGPSV